MTMSERTITRAQVEALRMPHAPDCEPRHTISERLCSCGAYDHNDVLDDVLALFDAPRPKQHAAEGE